MDAYTLAYLGVMIAKWATGSGIGLSVYMARMSLIAALTGKEVGPDPIGLMMFMGAGAIIALAKI